MNLRALLVSASCSAVALAAWMSGCSPGLKASDDGAGDGGAHAAACPACVTDKDCSGGVCAQIGGDSFCTPTCPIGNECAADRACTPVTTVSGQQSSACVPRGDICGPSAVDDAGAPPSMMCGTLVGPDTKASCVCSSGKTCSANGCYGGWWCDTATNRCHAPPTNCGGPPGGGVPFDGGPPVTSQTHTVRMNFRPGNRFRFSVCQFLRAGFFEVFPTTGLFTSASLKWSTTAAMAKTPPSRS